jgi:hypothetical protein
MRRGIYLLLGMLALLALVVLVGCTDNQFREQQVFGTQLTGAEEVPPVVTTASGTAQAVLSEDRQTLTVTLTGQGFSSPVISAHIHVGFPGENGPVIFTLFNRDNDGAFVSPDVTVLTAANLEPAPAQGITTFEEALQAIEIGRAYVNIHTETNQAGEIRGQLNLVTQ